MKKLLIVVAVFAAFVVSGFSQDTAFPVGIKVEKFTVTAKPLGVVIEKSAGVPPYWTVVGITDDSEGNRSYLLKTSGFKEMRVIKADDFAVAPSMAHKFKLAKFNSEGKFIPVDMINVNGKLHWIIVSE